MNLPPASPGPESSAAVTDPGETPPEAPPTPAEVEDYRLRLEERLRERYNNLPEFAGRVGRVTVFLARPIKMSLDGKLLRAEFDQLVHDNWGGRLPELEKEYFVVTFASGGAELARTDPSVRIGLDLEKTYSERVPLAADPFARPPDPAGASGRGGDHAMPEWWRPRLP
jgi:hypothetical protein